MRATHIHICEIMTPDPITVQASDSIIRAAEIMSEYEVGLVPVYSGKELRGVLTDRDIVLRHVAKGSACGQVVGDILSSRICSIPPEGSLDTAIQMMESNGVRRLLVLDKRGQLAGVVSKTEILRYLRSRL